MKQKLLRNPHPGIILLEEFLEPMVISVYKLAQELQIPQSRLSEITKGRRSITADTAIRLGRYFGLPAQFWLGLQNDYDIMESERDKIRIYKLITPLKISA